MNNIGINNEVGRCTAHPTLIKFVCSKHLSNWYYFTEI